jgi:hypothetical protein
VDGRDAHDARGLHGHVGVARIGDGCSDLGNGREREEKGNAVQRAGCVRAWEINAEP